MKRLLHLILLVLFVVTAHAQSANGLGSDNGGYVTRDNRFCQFIVQDGVLYLTNGSSDLYQAVLVRYPANHPAQTFTIPDGVRTIARGAFQGCKYLTEVSIPSSVWVIGDNAFENSSIQSFTTYESTYTAKVNTQNTDEAAKEMARYNVRGQKLSAPEPGVNIVEMSDHTTQKQLVR